MSRIAFAATALAVAEIMLLTECDALPQAVVPLYSTTTSSFTVQSGTRLYDKEPHGFRFQVQETANIVSVGAAVSETRPTPQTNGKFFISLVELDPPMFPFTTPSDYPDSIDLLSRDVLATRLLDIRSGQDSVAPLSLTLEPGWYALLVGIGRFGSVGAEATFNWGGPANSDLSWFEASAFFGSYTEGPAQLPRLGNTPFAPRVFINHLVEVPEPAAVPLAAIASFGLARRWRRRWQR